MAVVLHDSALSLLAREPRTFVRLNHWPLAATGYVSIRVLVSLTANKQLLFDA